MFKFRDEDIFIDGLVNHLYRSDRFKYSKSMTDSLRRMVILEDDYGPAVVYISFRGEKIIVVRSDQRDIIEQLSAVYLGEPCG